MELLNTVTTYKFKKKKNDWTMSSPIVIHGDKKSTLVTRTRERVKIVDEPNIQLKQVDFFTVTYGVQKINERHSS